MLKSNCTTSRIAVVIVNYGVSELIKLMLPSLLKEVSILSESHIIIVDNNSPKEDGDAIQNYIESLNHISNIEVAISPINGGFAAGVNVAFSIIRQRGWALDAILLLNPDAELHLGALREMLRVMNEHSRAGFVGPRLVNPDGSIWTAAFNFPSLMNELSAALEIGALIKRFPIVVPTSKVPVKVDWVTGTAVLIRWEAFCEIGDMDDGYFLYYEEVDYMLQGKRIGWESWHAPAALVAHEAGASTGVKHGKVRSGRQPDYLFRSWARYFSKNHGPLYARGVAVVKLLALAVGSLQRRLRGKPENMPEHFIADFATKVVLRRLSPPPCSALAVTLGGATASDRTA